MLEFQQPPSIATQLLGWSEYTCCKTEHFRTVHQESTEMKGRGDGEMEVKEERMPILHVVSFKLENNL